jgi:CDP-diacylglycerol--glycerol-3-phosphate 3-phosphatidyltransferase
MTISNDSRDRVKRAFEPIALGMGRLGLTPDALTLIGFLITVVGAILVAGQLWLVGGIVIFLGGAFDMFDGTLARATGRVSNLGAFMDSVFDRAGEVIVYVGIVVAGSSVGGASSLSILGAIAMASAFMVSYTRAKSEGLGFTVGTGMAAIGIMPREVRLAVLSVGLILTGIEGTANPLLRLSTTNVAGIDVVLPWAGERWLAIALAIIAIGATVTVIQRILHVRQQAKRQST